MLETKNALRHMRDSVCVVDDPVVGWDLALEVVGEILIADTGLTKSIKIINFSMKLFEI